MRAALLALFLFVVASVAGAMSIASIRCSFVSNGGGITSSASHRVESAVGQPSVADVSSANHRLRAGAIGCPVATVTGVPPEASLGAEFRLHDGAPNPFNPRTRIEFELPRDCDRVSMRIYDVTGRLVRVLMDGPQPAGTGSVVWNGQDLRGRTAGSGVYFVRFDADGWRQQRKLTLVK